MRRYERVWDPIMIKSLNRPKPVVQAKLASQAPRAVAWANAQVIAWMREQLVAAGGNPASIPDESFSYWRLSTGVQD